MVIPGDLFIFVPRQTNNLLHAMDLHKEIERNIRLRCAIRNLLANSDEVIRKSPARKSRKN